MDKKHNTITFHAPDLSTRQELPVAGGAVKAGFPSPADDFLDSPLDLNRELVHNPASTFFVRVSGDSMAGDGIGDGDLLVVDRSVEPYDGWHRRLLRRWGVHGQARASRKGVRMAHALESEIPSDTCRCRK